MSYDSDDTIAAIATAAGGAARGMVRVSGPATADVVGKCFLADNAAKKGTQLFSEKSCVPFFATRRATAVTGHLDVRLDDASTRPLPCDLFLWPTERSYTRQPVAEFHTLGSPPLLHAALEAICRAGARLAEPGEFTLRAFLAGRLDLTQAEAVLGVIDAQQADQLHTAIEQLAGGLARPLHQLRDELLTLLAELEAGLDFVEEDIEFISADELIARLQALAAEIHGIAEQMSSRLTGNATHQIALVGPPNAGKSSLFNALAERFGFANRPVTTAIVSGERGTTRDYLTVAIDVGGFRCELIDTAGIDSESAGATEIASAAQALSVERRKLAILRAFCVDASTPNGEDWFDQSDIVVLTKSDLAPERVEQLATRPCDVPIVATSSVTGRGLDELCRVLAALLSSAPAESRGSCVAATADRCRDSLRLADAAVARAAEIAADRGGDELIAAEIRVALAELGKVVGTVYTDDLLDRIFSSFCIGK